MRQFLRLIPFSHDKEECMRERVERHCYIAGGTVYSLYNGKEPKDIDIFVTDRSLLLDLITLFTGKLSNMKHSDSDIFISSYQGLRLVITNNAISIGKYQIVLKDYGEPEEVVGTFDFKHNMFYFRYGHVYNLVDWKFLETEKMFYNSNRARDVVGTIMRIPKFIGRGMTISNREMSKMLLKLNEVGFGDSELDILRENHSHKSFGS